MDISTLKLLKIGTIVYVVRDTFNIDRKKIFMTDSDGIEWSRYEKKLWTYRVDPYILVTRITHQVEGDSEIIKKSYFSVEDEYIFEPVTPDSETTALDLTSGDPELDEMFLTSSEANVYIEILKQSRNN